MYDLSSGTPTVPILTLQTPSLTPGDYFGVSAAISGTRVVVGASYDDTGADNAGSAYVYDLASGTPTVPIATLHNPSPNGVDLFGTVVAISGNRIVVAVSFDDTGGPDAGSAYVYDLASGTPTVPIVTLHNPSPAGSDNFGRSAAISGTLVGLGAPGDDTGAPSAGSAYVYDLASGTPTVPIVTLHNPSPALGDGFGDSISISGNRVVVGASNDDHGAQNTGSAYVYDLAGPAPATPVLRLNNPAPSTDDFYGNSLSISGPLVIVGASREDAAGTYAGAAYVYDISRAAPTIPLHTFTKPGITGNTNALSLFGGSVAIDGVRSVVGASGADDVATDKGYAYVFGPATSATQPPTLTAPATGAVIPAGLSVSFNLPEPVRPGTVKLSFQNGAEGHVLTLAASQETSGAHSFTFNPANPTASPEIAAGVLPDGTYTVALSYQDSLGSAAATSNAAGNVFVDATAPTVTPPAGGFAPLTFVTPVVIQDYRPQAVAFDAIGVTSVTQSPAPGTALAPGLTTVTITAMDGIGHSGSTTFDVRVLSFTQDTDGDGLNDAAEFQMAALGFNWQVAQPALVSTLFNNANGAGLYTNSQVQALNMDVPLLARNPATGQFKLTIGVRKSTDLQTFTPFPMTEPQTSINGAGQLEFLFTVPDNAAFFRVVPE